MANGLTLVTGGAGFIGSHLTRLLNEKGYNVIVLDNLSTGCRDNVPEGIPLYELDIRDRVGTQKLFRHYEGEITNVFHLAAHIDVLESMKKPAYDSEVNIIGSLNLLENCLEHGVKKIVNMSSYCIYGSPREIPVTENSPVHPDSYYGLSKLHAEIALLMSHEIDVVSIRGGNIYGPGQKISGNGDGGIIPILFQKIVTGKSPVLRGYGKTVRDYTYIDDACECIMMSINAEPGIYNLGTGVGVTVQEAWDTVSDACRRRGFQIPEAEYKALAYGEIEKMIVSPEKARLSFGWVPKTKFSDGVEATIGYLHDRMCAAENKTYD